MTHPIAAVCMFAALTPGFVVAQSPVLSDPESDRPYPLRVVIQTQPHPVFTPEFRLHVVRELGDVLAAGFGPLAAVEVIDLASVPRDNWEPLWQQFADQGFDALDDPRELSGIKTHFLRLTYHDGTYQLRSRQHDGFTGLASPIVRRSEVHNHAWLVRSASLLIDQDFGATGTIEPIEGRKDEVRVRFRGGQLAGFDRYVEAGDVFAVAAVRRTSRQAAEPVRAATGKILTPPANASTRNALQPVAREYTFLRINETPHDGVCVCAVLTRFGTPFPTASAVVAYRCLKLTTTTAPLSIRLVGGDGKPHPTASPFRVWATPTRFTSDPGPSDLLDSRGGIFHSNPNRPHSGVVCVVVGGSAKAERFPVIVLGTDPVVIKFELNEAAEAKAVHLRAITAVSNRAIEARAAQASCFESVAGLIQNRRNSEALARAISGFRSADTAAAALEEDVARLREEADASAEADAILTRVEAQVESLREDNGVLAARIKDLEAVVKRETGPAADAIVLSAERLNLQIQILLASGNVDEALNVYDQLVTLLPENGEVKDRRDKLREDWKPRNAEHAKARDLLFKTWPSLTTLAEFKRHLPEFRAAVDVCKSNSDRMGVEKLRASLPTFASKLNDLIASLDSTTEAGKQGLDDARVIHAELLKIEQEIAAFLRPVAK